MSEEVLIEKKLEVVDTTVKSEASVEGASEKPKAPTEDEIKAATPEVKDPTKVRTLQQMAVEQGAKLPKQLTPEQLRTQLLLDHHMGMTAVVPAFKSLSQRGKDRLWTAIMQLPHEGIETSLNGNFEKQVYLAAQKALMAKHAILFNRAKQEKIFEEAAIAEKEKKKKEAEERLQAEKKAVESKTEENASPEVKDESNTQPS